MLKTAEKLAALHQADTNEYVAPKLLWRLSMEIRSCSQ